MWMNWWMGRGLYDRQTGGPPTTGSPARRDVESPTLGSAPSADLVAGPRIWGASAEAAYRAVHGRSWKDLLVGWQTTSTMLATERAPGRLLAVVLLRAALLDEMEAQHPEAFAAWRGKQYGGRRRRC